MVGLRRHHLTFILTVILMALAIPILHLGITETVLHSRRILFQGARLRMDQSLSLHLTPRMLVLIALQCLRLICMQALYGTLHNIRLAAVLYLQRLESTRLTVSWMRRTALLPFLEAVMTQHYQAHQAGQTTQGCLPQDQPAAADMLDQMEPLRVLGPAQAHH
jgi:hypothetical protein